MGDEMEYYIMINGKEYLIPEHIVIDNEKNLKGYVKNVNEKNHIDLAKMKQENKSGSIEELYKYIKYYTETYAFNMAEVGSYNKIDKEFDPLKSYMKIKIILNENEKKMKTMADSEKYPLIDEGLTYLLELNELMFKNDEFENNKVK